MGARDWFALTGRKNPKRVRAAKAAHKHQRFQLEHPDCVESYRCEIRGWCKCSPTTEDVKMIIRQLPR